MEKMEIIGIPLVRNGSDKFTLHEVLDKLADQMVGKRWSAIGISLVNIEMEEGVLCGLPVLKDKNGEGGEFPIFPIAASLISITTVLKNTAKEGTSICPTPREMAILEEATGKYLEAIKRLRQAMGQRK